MPAGTYWQEIHPHNDLLKQWLSPAEKSELNQIPDYYISNGEIHYQQDIPRWLTQIQCLPHTRLIILYYSAYWLPLIILATKLGIRRKTPPPNWLTLNDLKSVALLAGFEVISNEKRILIPFRLPVIGYLFNRILAPLPVIRNACLLNIAILRPAPPPVCNQTKPSVSIIIPARNEAGNLKTLIERIPPMGTADEIIIVEGHSKDNTFAIAQQLSTLFPNKNITAIQQTGKGKSDAVQLGFSIAKNEILMILDADMTISPEELPKFYQLIHTGKAEFVNGNRLVYPMEKQAMRFFNLLANRFFAAAFTFLLNQPIKDTLCGTKVIHKTNYLKIARHRRYFGHFDPFGDFDLLFGAARLGLKIIDLPVPYKARTYGTTNISRWKHGLILFRMLVFAARKIRFR